jgi:2-iminobutanoate/2-iminopropanoate deaminase
MAHKAVTPIGAPPPIAPYSPAIDTGQLVFVSGQIGSDPSTGQLAEGGIEGQAEQALRNLSAVLDACGLTMSNVVKTTCFLVDMRDFDAFNGIYAKHVGDPKPARSTFAVAELPRGARVEIEAIAFRG